ncbi:AraC family transcriptional regulator [Nocardia nova]|uniref:AraC family transcriptional regulator n=1 Tax=Nocardia nova TaxID=37330 RepID=UPI0033C92990
MHAEQQRGATAPRASSFRTADVDVAHAEVAKTFAAHEMTVATDDTLRFRMDLASSDRLVLGKLGYGARVLLTAPPMQSAYHVNLPIVGGSRVEQRGRSGSSVAGHSGVALLPTEPLKVLWQAEGVQYSLKVPKQLLETHAAKLTGHPAADRLRFMLEFDLSSARARSLLAGVEFLFSELTRPGGMATMPAVRREFESALMTHLLLAIPNELTPALYAPPGRVRNSRIREIIDYIDEHPEADLSTANVAAMAGVSERAVQAGFRKLVGMSPREYIRGIRLDRVHAELTSSDAPLVTDIAMRWGFFHPGRFARMYQERFGVLPSETARR